MVDAVLPALPAPPVPPAPALQQPLQPPVLPNQPIPAHLIQYIPQLNWSYFKPELPDKPDEDGEAHLLRLNDWMD